MESRPRKRTCRFTDELEKEFPFMKKSRFTDTKVYCESCVSEFSLAHGGKNDITKHLTSEKHKKAVLHAASSSKITKFIRRTAFGEKEKNLAISEGVFSFHTIYHNHSFRSMDCTSRLIQKLFDPKFSCARTKTQAIIGNVLAPHVSSELELALSKVNYISLFTDASNHKDLKLFPILIRYFNEKTGIETKILDIANLKGETSDIITSYVIKSLENSNLSSKLIAFCADNTNTNFGGLARKGTNNVFAKIKNQCGAEVIGVGCAAHIVNNTIQNAADLLPVDLESIVKKIYSHFYIYTVRVEALKEFCLEAGVGYRQLLGYSETRWLALLPAVERILKLFIPLKSYFLSQSNCPVVIEKFFNDDTSELWLTFMHSQASIFHETVKQIEGDKNTIMQVSAALSRLKVKLEERKNEKFVPLIIRKLLTELESNGQIKRSQFLSHIEMFYANCLKYLNMWAANFAEAETFHWICLKSPISRLDVQQMYEYLAKKFPKTNIDENVLFDEISCFKKYLTMDKILDWNDKKVSVDERWIEVFSHFRNSNVPFENVLKMVEFALCLPGTNAVTERIFSLINNIWTSEKSQLQVETLKHVVMVRHHYNTCENFYNFISINEELLKKIHSAGKYA